MARIFTKLNLRSVYNLTHISESDEWKYFSTTSGLYEYCIISYGLPNMPSVFQVIISDVLCDMLGKFVIASIDNIPICSLSLESHVYGK